MKDNTKSTKGNKAAMMPACGAYQDRNTQECRRGREGTFNYTRIFQVWIS